MKKYDKVLFVTVLDTVLTEQGQAKVDAHNKENKDGMSLEWYQDMGLKPPEGLGEDGDYIEMGEGDTEEVGYASIFNIEEFSRCIDDGEGGSYLVLKNDMLYGIAEDSDEVYAQLKYWSQSWVEKAWQKIKDKFKNKEQIIQFKPE